jgi:hypothetical protein
LDAQVELMALRAESHPTAVGGELARCPARVVCIIPRKAEIDDEEGALSRALLVVIVGNRRAVTTEEVVLGLEDVHGLAPGTFSVHCHRRRISSSSSRRGRTRTWCSRRK